MLIIWKKYGILTPLMFIACAYLTQLLTDAVFGEHYYTQHRYVQALGLLTGSAALFVIGNLLDKEQQPNDFFFIRMKYWSIVGVLLAIGILFIA